MQDQITEILVYLKGTLKYKWVAIAIAWILCLSGWMVVISLPNKYTSEAKVHVETRTMLLPLLKSMTVQTDVRALLRVMQLLMFTRGNLEQIIALSNLDKDIKNPDEQSKLIEKLKKDIQIIGGADDIFAIKYESNDPSQATNVVQSVLTVFSEQTQQSPLAGADMAHHFIDQQIQEYETRLRNAEKAKENFKRANLGLLPDQGVDQIGQIQQIKTTLEDAKQLLKEAMSKRDVLKAQLDEALISGDENWAVLPDGQVTDEEGRLAELKQKKQDLLIKFTSKHPEIKYIDQTIKQLEKVNAEKREKITQLGGVESSVITNPYIQSIKVEMNTVDANIASIRSRVEMFEQRLTKSQDELNTRLSIETQIQNLNRDYDAIKRNYDQLLASREQASMSKKVDDQAEALKFKIADAPNVPLKPSSPNRELLFSVVLVAGIGMGVGVALLIYMLRPTVMSTAQLRQLTGLPILGTISMKISPVLEEKYRQDVLLFNLTFLGLIVVYALFMAVSIMGIKVTLLSRLLQSIL